MSILQFLLTFFILVIISSFAIYGWYIVTRGEWEVKPDGKWKKRGMLFKYWSLFFEQYRKSERVYWRGDYLDQKIDLLEHTLPLLGERVFLSGDTNSAFTDTPLSEYERGLIERTLLVSVIQNGGNLLFYTEEPKYDWPEWVKMPLSSCLTCMAGPYGTIIWLWFLKLQRGAFLWTDSPISAKIMLGVCFLLTLSYLNTVLHKLLKF